MDKIKLLSRATEKEADHTLPHNTGGPVFFKEKARAFFERARLAGY
jgi:hypothetical protein